jgi:hypothetical protein
MSEKTDIVTRLRDWFETESGLNIEEVITEAANEIEQLRMERDEARAESSCANDLVRLLQNEVRW